MSTFVAIGLAIYWNFFHNKDSIKLPKLIVSLKGFDADSVNKAPVKNPDMPLVLPEEPEKLQCYDPATAQWLGSVQMMKKEQVEEIVLKAKKAQVKWSESTFEERRAVMRAILDYFVENSRDISRVAVRDSGKTMLGAVLGEVLPTCEKLRWIISEGESILKTEYRGGKGILTMHKSARVEYHPVGVLGVLAPFNYPCHNLMNHVISGLFAGNAVVSKVSEYTSWSGDFYLRPVKQALISAGYSPDLVAVVTGMAESGSALVESSNVNKIIFTGSDRIGKLVMKGAAKNLTPVILELGGKDPFVVCDDVDLSWVQHTAMRGVFQNNGQNCIGIERMFVEGKSFAPFVEMMKKNVSALRQGYPSESEGEVDLGAMTNPASLKHIKELIDDAVAKGATLHCGGERNMDLAPGLFFKPTLITGITNEMRIATEEVFGPVMAISQWNSEEELFKVVNSCPYALGSSIFCSNITRARHISKNICAGMANINDFGVNYLCQSLPFGGTKCSGFGRFAGPEGLRACCYPKAITEDRIPGVKTNIPKPWCYPTATSAPTMAQNLVGMAYYSSLTQRASSTISLLKGMFSG